MARHGRNISAVRSTESGEQPQDDAGGPASWTEPETTGEGDIQEEIQRLENKKLQLLEQRKLQLLKEEVEVLRQC